jgi:hypothetical protein
MERRRAPPNRPRNHDMRRNFAALADSVDSKPAVDCNRNNSIQAFALLFWVSASISRNG